MSWRWWFMSDPHLSRPERQALDEQAEPGRIRLSAMRLWEAQMLHRKGLLELPLPFGERLRRAADPRLLTLAPLDVSVVTALDDLPGSFHRDPADRVIVATARVHAWRSPYTTGPFATPRCTALESWWQGLTRVTLPGAHVVMERGGPFHGRIAVLQN